MICFIYPGQPLEMDGKLPADPEFEAVARLTGDRTGFDLFSGQGHGKRSSLQVALQIFGTAMSLYRTRLLRKAGTQPAMVAEHSMGVYPALAACGSLSEGDALELTCRIGLCLAETHTTRDFALGCLTGLPMTSVLALAENNDIYLANYNTSRHFLLVGELKSIEEAMAEALTKGAFSARVFPCDAPLHTPLLEPISTALAAIVGDYSFREPAVPLMNHLDQDFLVAADIPGFLVRELCQPVYWERTYHALLKAGVNRFLEAGSGESLKKYNRWIMLEQG